MANKRQNQRGNVWASVLAFLLCVILVAGCVLGGLQLWGKGKVKPSNWGKDDEQKTEQGGGMELPEEAEANGLKIISVEIPRSRFAAMGVSSVAESAYTVTATVTGTGLTADQKKVTWTAAWADEFEPVIDGAESIKEEDVQTYVKTTVQEDTNQIQVECLKPFSWQVELTATSTFNTSKSASLKVDYKEKIEVTAIKFSDNNSYSKSVPLSDGKIGSGNTITPDYLLSKERTLSIFPTVERSEKYTVKGEEFDVSFTLTAPVTSGIKSYAKVTFNTSEKAAKTIDDFYDSAFHAILAKKDEAGIVGAYTELTNATAIYFDVSVSGANAGKIYVDLATSELETWYTAFSSVEVSIDHNEGIVF